MFIFGAGDMFGIPLFDASGNAVTNPTPVRLGTIQEMSLDFSGDVKKLYGQNQFAAVIARGKVDVAGKVKGATINGAMLNQLFFGQTMSTGTQVDANPDNTGVTVATTVTITPPNSGTFVADLGVTDGFGVPYTRVASAPAAGQYAVNIGTGVYTFAAGDVGKTAFVSYTYSASVSGAKKIAVQNLTMGAAPSFKAFMRTTFNGKKSLVIVYGCVAQKLGLLGTKLDDFNIPEYDFTGQQDPLGTAAVADIYVQE